MKNVKFILMDIEGTTTSLSFVKEILFPYSEKKMPDFIHKIETDNLKNETLKNIVQELKKEFGFKNNIEVEKVTTENIIKYLLSFIKDDIKHPLLKELQGHLWEYGYKNHDFKGHIYEDVPVSFEKWKNNNISLGIYSSGSVFAQKLLFGYSDYGDLTTYLSAYFDLAVGGKRENTSYEKISKLLKVSPNEILFLSDVLEELEAANKADFQVCQILRPEVIPQNKYQNKNTFLEL